MKIKKMVYCAGMVGTAVCSLLTLDKIKYANDVRNHCENEFSHDGNVITHRGFSSLEVENSFNAVSKGFESECVDGVEIDVRLTKDEELVLSHDASISGIGKISDKTLEEIQEKPYKSNCISKLSLLKECIIGIDGKLIYNRYKYESEKKEYIITLDDVLDNIESKKILLIDLKFSGNNDEKFMEKVNNVLSQYSGFLNITLQSDNYERLLDMKNKYPNYKYQLIIKNNKGLKYLDSDFEMFGIRKNLVTKNIVDYQIANGKKVSVWTINSYNDYEELKDELQERINDIFIITDYPDEICYLINNKGKTNILK